MTGSKTPYLFFWIACCAAIFFLHHELVATMLLFLGYIVLTVDEDEDHDSGTR